MEREPRTHRQCDHKRWWNGGFETLGGQPLRKRRAVRERRSGAPAMRLVLPPEKALHCYRPPGIGMDCHQCPFSPHNGRFLRHRFSPKPKVYATPDSLPKRKHVAKEAVSAALQTRTRQRSERRFKPNDAPKTKPRPCVKTMLCDRLRLVFGHQFPTVIVDSKRVIDSLAIIHQLLVGNPR